MIGNQKVVQAFQHEKEAMEQFDEINERVGQYSLKAIFFSSLTNPATRFVNSLVYTGVGITGALSAITGGISVGQLSCFLVMQINIQSHSMKYQALSQKCRMLLPVRQESLN